MKATVEVGSTPARLGHSSPEWIARVLQDAGVRNLRVHEPLRNHSSWKIGGPADVLVEPDSPEELAAVIGETTRRSIARTVIGHGTNLLFADDGVRGVVVKIGSGLSRLTFSAGLLEAEAGAWVPGVALRAAQADMGELEHIVGIPGTLGGLVAMNGGSRRKCIGDTIIAVHVLDAGGNSKTLLREECEFRHRASIFQRLDSVIWKVTLRRSFAPRRAVRAQMRAILKERRGKFPRKLPNCGSVFVSDPRHYAQFGPPGRVIEQAGLKGLRHGDAQVSPMHANFIVNLGNARASDVLALMLRIRQVVRASTGLLLEAEAKYVRPDGTMVPAHEALHSYDW